MPTEAQNFGTAAFAFIEHVESLSNVDDVMNAMESIP
jgi:hypothetical protein